MRASTIVGLHFNTSIQNGFWSSFTKQVVLFVVITTQNAHTLTSSSEFKGKFPMIMIFPVVARIADADIRVVTSEAFICTYIIWDTNFLGKDMKGRLRRFPCLAIYCLSEAIVQLLLLFFQASTHPTPPRFFVPLACKGNAQKKKACPTNSGGTKEFSFLFSPSSAPPLDRSHCTAKRFSQSRPSRSETQDDAFFFSRAWRGMPKRETRGVVFVSRVSACSCVCVRKLFLRKSFSFYFFLGERGGEERKARGGNLCAHHFPSHPLGVIVFLLVWFLCCFRFWCAFLFFNLTKKKKKPFPFVAVNP